MYVPNFGNSHALSDSVKVETTLVQHARMLVEAALSANGARIREVGFPGTKEMATDAPGFEVVQDWLSNVAIQTEHGLICLTGGFHSLSNRRRRITSANARIHWNDVGPKLEIVSRKTGEVLLAISCAPNCAAPVMELWGHDWR